MKTWFAGKDRLMAGTIIAGASALGLVSPAMAQETDGASEEIIVTGSRIPQPNLQSVSPITTVGADEIGSRGVTRIEDMINQLPQAYVGQAATVANAASGTATTDLRALGANRTLALINGRRMVAGDPVAPSSVSGDLNMIPAVLVQRVEVLTGGASAVYGADAVAGVVNFIMRDDFEGFRVNVEHSFYQTDTSDDYLGDLPDNAAANPRFFQIPEDNQLDGESYAATLVFGASSGDGRGNVTAYLDYRNTQPVLQANRGFSACAFGDNYYPAPAPALYCLGSSTSFPAAIQPATQVPTYQFGQFVASNALRARRMVNPDGSGTLIPQTPNFFFNYAPYNHFQRPDDRYAGGAYAHYEINPHLEVYGEFMFMDDRSLAQIAPSGAFAGAGPGSLRGNYITNCDNAFLSADMISFLCNSDSQPDAYDPATATAAADRLAAINALIALGDNPNTADCNEATSTVTGCAADEVDATVGLGPLGNGQLLQPTCPDPDPSTAANEAICVIGLRTRNVNGDPRIADLRHTQYRYVAGARGELAEGWNYDVYAMYGTMIYQQNYLNEVSLSRLMRALVNKGGQCGVNVDDDVTNNDPGCVPINVFDGVNGPTAAQVDYVQSDGLIMGSTSQNVFSAALTGDLSTIGMTLPSAEDGVKVALGVETRTDELELRPDSAFCPSDNDQVVSDLLGQGATTCSSSGSINVVEVFGEANIPLAQNRPGFYSLGLDLGYRFSDYEVSGGNKELNGANTFTTDTYKIGGHWAPTEDIRLRGGYNRAVRAPNIVELFAPQTVGLAGTTDPCAGAAPAASQAACENFGGLLPGQYGFVDNNPAAQYNGLASGNFALNPETAETITIGLVFTPSFFSGFTASLDYYNIQVTDRIGVIGTDTILKQCLETGAPSLCSRVHRDGAGSLWLSPDGFIVDLNENHGSYEVTGYDLDVTYRFDAGGAGRFGANYQASFLDEYLVSPDPEVPSFDCAGLYGPACAGSIGGFGNPLPQYRHKFRVDWDTPVTGLSLTATWRHLDSVDLEPDSAEDFAARVAAAFGDPAAAHLPTGSLVLDAQNYFDISGSWAVWENVIFRAGVNNVTDEDPPLSGASFCPAGPCSGNTWPGTYDALGRYIFLGVTADF